MRSYFLLLSFLMIGNVLQAQNRTDFRQGSYYDMSGQKHSGLIKYKYDYRKMIKYKASAEGKVTKLTPRNIKGFVVEADSFFVMYNFLMEGAGGGEHLVDLDFVQVVEPGPLTLVKHFSTQGSAGPYGGSSFSLETYLLVDDRGKTTLVKKRPKKFKESMAAFFKENPDIVEKIQKEEYTWTDMPTLVRLYNKKDQT